MWVLEGFKDIYSARFGTICLSSVLRLYYRVCHRSCPRIKYSILKPEFCQSELDSVS